MDNQDNRLNELIDSSAKIVTSFPMGMRKIGLNLYRNKNDSVLILIGSFNEGAKYKYLNNYDAISEKELFLRFSTGCTGPSSIDYMLESFDKYHDESVSSDISGFLQSLEASKIVICYSESYGASTAVLVMLYKIFQKINIDCIPIIVKPASFQGRACFKRYFTDLLTFIDTSTYHIYDESLCVYKLGTKITSNELKNASQVELLKIVNSIMGR